MAKRSSVKRFVAPVGKTRFASLVDIKDRRAFNKLSDKDLMKIVKDRKSPELKKNVAEDFLIARGVLSVRKEEFETRRRL